MQLTAREIEVLLMAMAMRQAKMPDQTQDERMEMADLVARLRHELARLETADMMKRYKKGELR